MGPARHGGVRACRLRARRDRPTFPGRVALQYWFFYAFNDFNNKHEGDWEMIQLVFDGDDAAAALARDRPAEVGYSSHEGAERAEWGDDKLEIVDGTHPVVFPAAGSHANKYTAALYLGSSADAGVGCDDTEGPHRELRPVVLTIPSDPKAAEGALPWITFEGRWGELQKAFFNGPTGPNLKDQWTAPIEWAEGWRDRSYAVPTGGILGTGATDLFCTGVERGSAALMRLLRNPGATLVFLALLLGLVAYAVVRATWTPVAPLRVARRRTWGQVLAASARMYVKHMRLFVGLGLLLLPIMLVVTALQWLLINALEAIGSVTGDLAGLFAYVAVLIGTTLALLGFGLVQAATACALVELDAGRPIGIVPAYRLALRRFRPLLGAIGIFVVVWVTLRLDGLPDPDRDLARRALVAGRSRRRARRRLGLGCAPSQQGSSYGGRWLRVGSLVGLGALVALLAGPLLGALLIFVSNSSLALMNLVAGVVYVIALPFIALVTSYVYFDARTPRGTGAAGMRATSFRPRSRSIRPDPRRFGGGSSPAARGSCGTVWKAGRSSPHFPESFCAGLWRGSSPRPLGVTQPMPPPKARRARASHSRRACDCQWSSGRRIAPVPPAARSGSLPLPPTARQPGDP